MLLDKSLAALCLISLVSLTSPAQVSVTITNPDGSTINTSLPPGQAKKITDLPNVIVNTDVIERTVSKLKKAWKAKTIKKFKNKLRYSLKNFLGSLIPASLDIPAEFQQAYSSSESNNNLKSKAFVASGSDVNQNNTTIPKEDPLPKTATTTTVFLDLREKYPYCRSIKLIRDQSNCGSCWAFVTANTISDRFCIAKGTTRFMSPQDLLECCVGCLLYSKENCSGGYVHLALYYMKNIGACTGESYNDFSMCKPYFMEPNTDTEVISIPCKRSCAQPKVYPVTYTSDRLSILNYIYFNGEAAIIEQLESGGTVILTFDLYEDFFTYKSGVYEYTVGEQLDVHSVRVIGYGIQDDVPYWLCANTWGIEWGENGFVKIKRGSNVCNIENYPAFAPIIR